MNLAKIIKIYFVFMLITVSLGALSYNKGVVNYFSSVFHITEMDFKSGTASSFYISDFVKDEVYNDVFVNNNSNPNILNFNLVNDPSEAHASAGDKNVKIMGIYFKTDEMDLSLDELTFKIVGVDAENITDAVLTCDSTVIDEASLSDGYLTFKNIDFEMGSNEEKTLYLYVDLGTSLTTGERVRLDIESPDDVVLSVGGEPYALNKYYPIEGKYLSIAHNRPWKF
jgi:hypothetical protein